MVARIEDLTFEQKYAVEQIWDRVHLARHAVLVNLGRPGVLHVSPETFRLLCPDGPIFVYAAPYPRLMGMDVHPDPNLRGFDVAVTERI